MGDERVLGQAHGLAHRALSVPTTLTTRFAVASGSKAFTALAVMRLVEDGVLAVQDRVRPVDDLPLIDDSVTEADRDPVPNSRSKAASPSRRACSCAFDAGTTVTRESSSV